MTISAVQDGFNVPVNVRKGAVQTTPSARLHRTIPHYHQRTLFDSKNEEYDIEEVEDEEAGYICEFRIAEIRKQSEEYEELLDALNGDKFVFKKQYLTAQKFMKEIATKQKHEDDSLLDLL